MNAHRETPHDPDDWFDEPQPTPPRQTSRAPVWVDPDAQTREHHGRPAARSARTATTANRRLLVAAGLALAVFLVALALTGVFSSAGKKKASTLPTLPTATTTTQAQPQTVPLPTAAPKLGDHGNAVKQLQRALRSLHLMVGAIDGVFGASTQSALIAFQTAHRLSPDGVLGPATRAALLNALRPG